MTGSVLGAGDAQDREGPERNNLYDLDSLVIAPGSMV